MKSTSHFPLRGSLAGLTLALTACSGAGESPQPRQKVALDAGRWAVYEVDGSAPVRKDETWVSIDTQARTLRASAGCNQLQATYTGSADDLTVGPVAATKRGCPDDLMAQERRLTELLSSASTMYVDDEGVLWISGSRGVLRARQAPAADE